MKISSGRVGCARRRVPPMLAFATVLALLWCAGAAVAAAYTPGFYAGQTGQGKAFTLEAAGGEVTNLYTEIVDGCRPGTWDDFLFPHPATITAAGRWYHHTTEDPQQPTIYRGRFHANQAIGTIVDTVDNNRGRACHGHTSFRATRSSPLRIGPATVGGLGTDVLLRLTLPYSDDGNLAVPYTPAGLLVYASNTGCPASYAAADALARSVNAAGDTGLITDAYVDADYEVQPYELAYRAYHSGVFTFHVATNTVLPTADGQSPFSAVCAMLYRGTPASLTPSGNTALETTQARLIAGPGIPDTQP